MWQEHWKLGCSNLWREQKCEMSVGGAGKPTEPQQAQVAYFSDADWAELQDQLIYSLVLLYCYLWLFLLLRLYKIEGWARNDMYTTYLQSA